MPLSYTKVSIDKGTYHLCTECLSLKWAPSALVEQVCLAYLPRSIHIYEHKVGIVAFAQVASVLYLKEDSRVMTHLLHKGFDSYLTFFACSSIATKECCTKGPPEGIFV